MAIFFYGWASTASRLEPFRGGSLLFTTEFLSTFFLSVFDGSLSIDGFNFIYN